MLFSSTIFAASQLHPEISCTSQSAGKVAHTPCPLYTFLSGSQLCCLNSQSLRKPETADGVRAEGWCFWQQTARLLSWRWERQEASGPLGANHWRKLRMSLLRNAIISSKIYNCADDVLLCGYSDANEFDIRELLEFTAYSLTWFSVLLAIFEKISGKCIANKHITWYTGGGGGSST